MNQVAVDSCPTMMGGDLGFRGFVQRKNANVSVEHCTIHRYSLASKTLPETLKAVFDQAVKIVNFINAKELNKPHFQGALYGCGRKTRSSAISH